MQYFKSGRHCQPLRSQRRRNVGWAKPVLAINTLTYWDALRRSGIADRVRGYGRILEDF
jgi:maleate cis-trans isomerase